MQVLRSPLLLALRGLAGPTGRFAAAILTRNPRRAGLTVAVLGVGLGSVFWLSFVAKSFERSVIDALAPALRADLIVGSSRIESGVFEAPIHDRLARKLK